MSKLFLPDLLLTDGGVLRDAGLLTGSDGVVSTVMRADDVEAQRFSDMEVIRLKGKALLPGLANAHSHSFQRLFRGRAEGRAQGGDTFWTWREQMYRAAAFVSPEDVHDVARATFLEMLTAGITVVGEFHYLHNDPAGHPYTDPNELAHQVIRAAESVGIRICLLRTAYARAGFRKAPHPGQRRFYESVDAYLGNLEALLSSATDKACVSVGAAPHSIRAVALAELERIAGFATTHSLPLHMHISEQPAENEACLAEYRKTPVQLVDEHGVLTKRTTLVHAIHLSSEEFDKVRLAGSTLCSCPTTERNLGDGIFPADMAARLGIPVAFGSDSQAQINILEDARQNEYHLRLRDRERGILDTFGDPEIAARLFNSASAAGYRALSIDAGCLAPGQPADFFTIDLNDLSILGTDEESLKAQAVFALERSAVRDVAVSGRLVLTDGHHALEDEIRVRYLEVQRRFVQQEAL